MHPSQFGAGRLHDRWLKPPRSFDALEREKDRIPAGTWVERGDLLGHPSCEGGFSTGTHLHFARKYNGEWIMADGPLPFVLSGWTVHAGEKAYDGTLTRGERTVPANPLSPFVSRIIRRSTDP